MRLLRRHWAGALVVASGAGAAAATLLIGVPTLWSAEAAGWASALATFLAVLVALFATQAQLSADRAREDRERREKRHAAEQAAVRLAHGFSRELLYARRRLITMLIDWDPDLFAITSEVVIEAFANVKPLPDLVLVGSTTDRLDGFSDADAFMLLTALTTWQFFNAGPGLTAEEIKAVSPMRRKEMAERRLRFGLDLERLLSDAINRMATYYEDHSAITASINADISPPAKAVFDKLKARYGMRA